MAKDDVIIYMTPVLTHATPTGLISSFSNGSKGLISSTPWDPGIPDPLRSVGGFSIISLRVGEKVLEPGALVVPNKMFFYR